MSVDVPTSGKAGTTRFGRVAAALLASQFGVYVAIITPLQLLLTLRLVGITGSSGAATNAFGVATGLAAIVVLVVTPVAGRISDLAAFALGRRRTWILFGALTGATALVVLGQADAVWQVVLLWCLAKALFSFQQASTTAVLADQVPAERRGLASGLLGLVIPFAPMLGLIVVNQLPPGSALQWQVVAAIAAAGGVVAVLLIREGRPERRPIAPGGLGELLKSFWLDPRRYPAFGWAWLVRFLITATYAAGSYVSLYLIQRFGVGQAEVGGLVLIWSVVNVPAAIIGSLGCGYLSDVLRRQKPFVIASAAIGVVSMALLAFAPSLTVVFVAAGVLGLGMGMFLAVDMAMCVRVLPDGANAGKDLGIVNIANMLPQSLVPLVAPLLLALGGYTAFFGFLALLGIAGALAVRRVPEVGQEGGAPGVAPLRRA
ncbi:MFS transporter [Actinosynnema mirum]|uniref:Major facilitator superfamily MFS_1 n=1 Tax=Actinosynnema mirum (strain ATCC 29888 / DSM 43827 / JCM 3225 / NBRC 14064 / NCIMB 13271 / NRRL B-12336 / IMRU 3971 / 101) TaxID=446462 RepID=C6WK23_ACTMD|nr:MFS transporter [Actinosynnema mirum]ACU38236.1 major facilitator superfamily MFS_1 [Actinosynnema mirum DSM 43827]